MNILPQFVNRMIGRPGNFRTGMIRLIGFLSRRFQKEGRNPLPFLTPQEARALYELYRKGQYADVMLCWAALEETDDMLGTVLDRRASALAEAATALRTVPPWRLPSREPSAGAESSTCKIPFSRLHTPYSASGVKASSGKASR